MNRALCFIITMIFFSSTTCLADSNLNSSLQQMLTDSLTDNSAPGAVMLVADSNIGTLTFAAGESDLATHTPMKVTDTFRIASMSKTFMAAAVLKLVEAGKLKLTDRISTVLPENIQIHRIPNGTTLTVKDLLQMRSGIPDYYQSDEYDALYAANPNRIVSAREALATMYDQKPLYAAGKQYYYSNTNYVLLQLIIEKITGKSLSIALNDLIIKPLHLTNTFVSDEKYFAGTDNQGLTTHGYHLNDDHQFVDVTKKYDGNGLGDGCIITNLMDLKTFLTALLVDKKLLSADSLKSMLHLVDGYGLGISSDDTEGGLYYTHNGNASGYSGQYYLGPSKTMVIILTNSDATMFIDQLSDDVYQRL